MRLPWLKVEFDGLTIPDLFCVVSNAIQSGEPIFMGTPNRVALRDQAQDKNHFHPDYFPKGILWQLPDLTHSEAAYALARQNFENSNRRILDATVNGKCPVFERVDYWSLFK